MEKNTCIFCGSEYKIPTGSRTSKFYKFYCSSFCKNRARHEAGSRPKIMQINITENKEEQPDEEERRHWVYDNGIGDWVKKTEGEICEEIKKKTFGRIVC